MKTHRQRLTLAYHLLLVCLLTFSTVWPLAGPPTSLGAAPPDAPPTPTPSVSPTPRLSEPDISSQSITPPSPEDLPPEAEQARARQAMEAALAKYLHYWGPRYQAATIAAAVKGEWAHGVAQWQGEAKTLSGSIHILAHRQPDGSWQALLPGSDGLYRQWLEAVPESLVPGGEKGRLHAQAAEAGALWKPMATPVVPPAATVMPSDKEGPGEPVEPVAGLMQLTATPTLQVFRLPQELRYVYVRDGNIWMTDKAGQSHRQLTFGGHDSAPVLSPDGRFVAYLSVFPEYLGSAPTPQNICIVDRVTGNSSCLTDEPALRGSPVWSPNGTRLAYVEERHLVVVSTDGNEQSIVATNVMLDGPSFAIPAWSPDSSILACILVDSEGAAIWTINPDTGLKRLLMRLKYTIGMPIKFSPDGNLITIVDPYDEGRLWAIPLDGSVPARVSDFATMIYSFAWSPSGERIAYSTTEGSVWTLDLRTETLREVSEGKFQEPPPEVKWIGNTEEILLTTPTISGTGLTVLSLADRQKSMLTPVVVEGQFTAEDFLLPLGDITAPFEWYRYQGEWDSGSCNYNNCGPTSVAMGIQFAHNNQWVAISDIRSYVSGSDCRWTNLNDLRSVLNHWGVDHTIITGMDAVRDAVNNRGHIVIVPVWMSYVPPGSDYQSPYSNPANHYNRYYSYNSGHFLVVKGISSDNNWVIVHDPNVWDGNGVYWYSDSSAKGKSRYYSYSNFTTAFANNGNQAIEILEIPGGGSACPAPSLIEPGDNATLPSRTITFRWNAVNGCTFNGYTFRVCTSPDVDNLSNCFIDTGEGGTQRTETINGRDNQDLYWGVRAANTPNGANWAVRHFRIEPGSPNGNWEARYDQGDTCWWDPNCNMNPRCTETIIGPELHKNWGSNAPCGGMSGDNWVGDFRANINFPTGDYVFQLDHDDGVKLWLNGQNIQDRGGSGSGPVCPARHLSGDTQLRVLLREQGGDARVNLTWTTDTSICPSSEVKLFSLVNYQGGVVFSGGTGFSNAPNADSYSMEFPSGWSVKTWRGDNRTGEERCWIQSVPNLQDHGWHLAIQSIEAFDSNVCPPVPPSLQSPSNGTILNEGDSITLSWSATGDQYYGEVWGGPGGTLIFGWQHETSKNIGSQWAGYTYSWHVKARNSAGESGWSSTWTFTVRPATPSNLSAQVVSCNQVNLYWNDNSGNEEGYKIYRNGTLIGQVGMNTTSYQDTGLSENTDYSYYVRAFRGSIESNNSNTVNVHTPPCPTGPDLTPAQWSGWQYPIVPSSVTDTTVVNTLYAGYPTYIDWGLANNGDTNTGGNTYGDLYIDSTRVAHHDFGNVLAGQSWAFFDWPETVNTPGWHTLKVVTDPDNLIAESNETNNVWERQFYWTPIAPYADDMENGVNDWTATGLWHQVDGNSPYPASHSGTRSWWYGQDSTGNYDTGAANSGDLTSPSIYIPTSGYYLRFWYQYETETRSPNWDQRWVQISVDGGPFNNVLQLYDDPMNWWLQSPAVNLSGYAGHTLRVRFHFDTLDDGFNAYRGWYLDDFDISSTPPPSCADSYEPNNTPAQARAIAYGQSRSADICPGGDYDYYQFTGAAGDRVVVDIDAKANGSWLDSYIFLLDSDGTNVLAENDDEIEFEVQDSHLGYQLPHDGTYYIKVRAWDHPSAGGTGCFYTIRLLRDNTNPSSAAITSPGNDAWLNPSLETITVSATDSQSGISHVAFLWHDADWENSDWVWLGEDWDGRDGWNWGFDTSGLAEQRGGAFYIWAFDWAGNWTGAGVWNVGIDRTPPTAGADVSLMYGDAPFLDFYVWWSGSDNLSGTASYDVQYRDGAGGAWTNLLNGTTDTYYRFVGQNGHTYYFRARARDYAGNLSTYASGGGDAQHTVQICAVAADAYESDNSHTTAKAIATNSAEQSHNFHAVGDRDWLKFTAGAGITYTLVTTNTGGHADTTISVYASDGATLLAFNDDDPDRWPASRLEWGATRGGTYYVKVEHWDPYAYGCTTAYDLSIAETGTFEVSEEKVFLPIILRNAR